MDKDTFIKSYLAPLMFALDPGIEEIRHIERPNSRREIIAIKHKGSISFEHVEITNQSIDMTTLNTIMVVLTYLENKRRNPPLGQA